MYMCTPDTVTFTKDMSGVASFTWDFDDGTTNTVDANPVHIFTNTDPSQIEYYNVKLTVVSPGGCQATYTQVYADCLSFNQCRISHQIPTSFAAVMQ